jgi:hypothetical protein
MKGDQSYIVYESWISTRLTLFILSVKSKIIRPRIERASDLYVSDYLVGSIDGGQVTVDSISPLIH